MNMASYKPVSLFNQLKIRWNAELPSFWIKVQKFMFVIGGISALLSNDVKSYLPNIVLVFLACMSFTSAFIAQFTKIDNEVK